MPPGACEGATCEDAAMPHAPEVVLFDADGVVQQTPPGWEAELNAVLGSAPQVEQLLLELFTAELPALAGDRDFAEVTREVLARWDLADRTEEVLAFWTRLELDEGVTELIRELRAGGAACYLATNQHHLRRAYMSTSLGYDELLDGQLYSCDLRVAKPDPAYFTAALERIGRPAGTALFIDDREANVLGARSAGLRAEVFHLSSGADALRAILSSHGLL
jgi:putative hydrolase of the HAD superfamily